jgi:hypothetical protein
MIGTHGFLLELFRGTEGPIYVCALRNNKSQMPSGELDHIITRNLNQVKSFRDKWDRPEHECGIYYHTATLKPGATRRIKQNCHHFISLFSDTDDDNHELSRDMARVLLEQAECPPTLVVDSGHGLQAYWLLTERCNDPDRIEKARKAIQSITASDSVADAARVMRLVGSHNSKLGNGEWLTAEIVSHAPERRYRLEDLECWLEQAAVIIPRKPEQQSKANGHARQHLDTAADTDLDRIRDALRHISADDRQIWLEIGMALKDELGDAGRTIWDEWSASCAEKYSDRDQAKTWRSFKRSGIGIGTLFHYAEQHGYCHDADRHMKRSQQAREKDAEVEQNAYKQTGDDLPELVINESDPTATAKELAALIAKTDNFLFNGYGPIRTAVEAKGIPRALEVTTEAVRVVAHEICDPVKLRKIKGKIKSIPVPLSRDISLLYLNGLEGRWGLNSFRGITTAPILKHDGNIRIASGYDAETGLWCHNIPELRLAARPSDADAQTALSRLRYFFRTFPYGDGERLPDPHLGVEVADLSKPPGLDESTFLVALLTAVCRQSLDLAPGYLVRAPTVSGAGTGKGLMVSALCIVGSGARPSAFTSGHDKEELDKRLTAALVEAHPSVFLDNFNGGELRSDILASALTQDPAMVRPMGHTKMVPLHTRTFIVITGNAVEIAEDMARRVIVTNFDARMEDPEARKFAPGFLESVFASRAKLLTDALIVWRWGRQSKLKAGKPLGNYELWCQWCRDPILALGGRDPVDRIAEIKAADPTRAHLVEIFDAWWAAHGDDMIKANDLDPNVIEHIDSKATRKADGSLQFSRQRVAGWLRITAGVCLGGYTLRQIKDTRRARPVTHYKLQRTEKAE